MRKRRTSDVAADFSKAIAEIMKDELIKHRWKKVFVYFAGSQLVDLRRAHQKAGATGLAKDIEKATAADALFLRTMKILGPQRRKPRAIVKGVER